MTKDNRKDLGRLGEEFAAAFLQSSGYKVLERNFRVRSGEADIIASMGDTIYFFEVKTRKHGSVREDYSEHQRKRLRKVAEMYMIQRKSEEQVSFHVIEVIGDPERENPLVEIIDDNYSM